MNISPLISLIVGGLLIDSHFGLFVIVVYLVRYFKKYKFSLILFLLYLLSIGYLIKINNIYDSCNIVLLIALIIPHVIVLDDLLGHEFNNLKIHVKDTKIDLDIILGILYIISYFDIYLFIFIVIGHLFILLYNKTYNKWLYAVIPPILLVYGVISIFTNTLTHSYVLQCAVLAGIGLLCFFGFLLNDSEVVGEKT